MVEKNRKIPRI